REIGLDRRQRDVDDGFVDKGDARTEDGHGQNPRLGVGGAMTRRGGGAEWHFVARLRSGVDHRLGPSSWRTKRRRPSIASTCGRIIRTAMIATNVHTRKIAEFVS